MRIITKHPSPEDVFQHFKDMTEGKLVRLETRGYGRRDFLKPYQAPLAYLRKVQPPIKLVTPVAMAEKQAHALLVQSVSSHKRKRPIRTRGRKASKKAAKSKKSS